MRGVITPIAEKVGVYAKEAIEYVEKYTATKTSPPEIVPEPVREITPGPLEIKTSSQDPVVAPTGITRASIMYWTNIQRKNNGNLPPLVENSILNTTATAKTADLFAKSYFEHTSPSGVTVATQAISAEYEYIMIGENLALGNFASGQAIVEAWMNSPGHRANILNDRYSQIGVGIRQGVYQGRTVWIITQHFGLPRNACPAVNESLKSDITLHQTQIQELKVKIDAKKKEVDTTSQLSSSYNDRINEYNALVREFNALIIDTKEEVTTYNTQVNSYNTCVQG